jgi:hypothetical protein
MTSVPAWLASSRRSAARYRAAVHRDPLAHFLGTPPQIALWSNPSKRRMLRTGNQVGGKTTAALVEALWWATHTHPYRRTPSRPVQIWFVCVSWTQSLNIQHKLWRLAPKQALTPDTLRRYTPERGFGANAPVVTFLDGSQIWVKTGKQDALDQAGGTVDLVCYDEPPKRQRNFSELERRLTRTGGDLVLTMTPINARIDWIRELAEGGGITDLHFRCTPEMMRLPNGTTLRTDAGELMDGDWIASERRKVMSWEEPVVIDGEWEMRADGQVFEAWNHETHVFAGLYENTDIGPKGRPVRLVLGIDWGDESLRTAAILCAVQRGDDRKGIPTRVWIVDEYVPRHATTTAMDADGVLAMLARRGLRWSMLAAVHGDKRYTDAKGRVTKKSNARFEAAVALRIGTAGRTVPRVQSAKRGARRGAGAVWSSIRWIHERMITPGGFAVDASCVDMVEAIDTWDGTERHIAKDRIDGLRYALVEEWAGRARGFVAARVQIR